MKRNFKKTLSCISFVAMVFSIATFNASARTGYAYSFFTNANATTPPIFHNETQMKQYAYYWDSLGRHSYYNSECTFSYVNSTSRINTEFVTFVGHASPDVIQVHEGPLVSITKWNTNSAAGDVGLQSFTLSDVRLMIFAGCSTAGTSSSGNNICQTAINRGADTVLGFTNIVARQDCTPFITNFARRAAAGYTMQECLTYANSFSYTNNNIKCGRLYGNTTQRFSSIKASRAALYEDTEINIGEINLTYEDDDLTEIYETVQNELPDIDIEDFKPSYTSTSDDNSSFVLDLVQYVGDIPTDNVITIVFEEGKAVLARDNRTVEVLTVPVFASNKAVKIEAKKATLNNSISQMLSNKGSIIEQEGTIYFNCAAGEYRYKVITTYENEQGLKDAFTNEIVL